MATLLANEAVATHFSATDGRHRDRWGGGGAYGSYYYFLLPAFILRGTPSL